MTSDLKENFLNIWDRLGEWVLYAALLILPVFSLPYTIFPVELNKSYLTFFLIILSGILYLSSILRTGEFSLSKNLLYPLILLLLLIFLQTPPSLRRLPSNNISPQKIPDIHKRHSPKV